MQTRAATAPAQSGQSVIGRHAGSLGTACEAAYAKLPAGRDPVVGKLQAERQNMIAASVRNLG